MGDQQNVSNKNMQKIILDKAGIPLNKTQRLPSLRLPRDLMMGRPIKKVFTPNLNQALTRKNKESQSNEHMITNGRESRLTNGSLLKDKKSTSKQMNRKRETIQSSDSIFAQGPSIDLKVKGGITTIGQGNRGQGNKSYGECNKKSFKKEHNDKDNSSKFFYAGDEESKFVKNLLLNKASMDDDTEILTKPELIDPHGMPIKLPLTAALEKLGKEMQMGNAVFRDVCSEMRGQRDLKPALHLEPDAFPNGSLKDFAPTLEDLGPHGPSDLWDLIVRERLLSPTFSTDAPPDRYDGPRSYVFQFPGQTPFSSAGAPDPTGDMETADPNNSHDDSHLGTSDAQVAVGKLQITECGRIFFKATDHDRNVRSFPMEMATSVSRSFLENLVAISLDDTPEAGKDKPDAGNDADNGGEMINLGRVTDHFIMTPAIDRWLADS